MGFFGSFGNAISSAYNSVSSFCSSTVSGIGSALSSAANYLGTGLSTALTMSGGLLGAVSNIASNLLQNLGLFEKSERTEDMGDRALQAEAQGITPQNFDNFSEYIDNLRSFELDAQKSNEITTDQKNFKGLEVAGRALEDKYNAPEGSMASAWALASQNPDFFTSQRFETLLGSSMDFTAIADYFSGKIDAANQLDIENSIIKADLAANPSKDEIECREEIYAAKINSINIYI